MLVEFNLVVESIKTSLGIIKGFNELKHDYEIKSATSELLNLLINTQTNLFTIQSSYHELLEINNGLTKELMQLKEWNANKLNYSLCDLAPGNAVYIIKDSNGPINEKHWYCQNCFDNNQKLSVFQLSEPSSKHRSHNTYFCPNCPGKIILPNPDYIKSIPEVDKQNSSWETTF